MHSAKPFHGRILFTTLTVFVGVAVFAAFQWHLTATDYVLAALMLVSLALAFYVEHSGRVKQAQFPQSGGTAAVGSTLALRESLSAAEQITCPECDGDGGFMAQCPCRTGCHLCNGTGESGVACNTCGGSGRIESSQGES